MGYALRNVLDNVRMARGGAVRTHYVSGGAVELPNPAGLPSIMPNMIDELPASNALPGPAAQPAAPLVTPQPAPAAPSVPGGDSTLAGLMERYMQPQSTYAGELAAARRAAAAETKAFNDLLAKALEQPDNAPSKAELYFRLASAFGSPTKTGRFTENLALAGKEMAEDAKARREAATADRATKLQIGITGQKAKMDAAKDDLTTLRTLAAEEMKDQRAIQTKLIESYIKSGDPDSPPGKQAKDEGFKPGTPEFQARVKVIAEAMLKAQQAQATLSLAEQRLLFQREQATRLTPQEVKLKVDTEDGIAANDSAMNALRDAYRLSAQAFGNTAADIAQRTALEQTQPDHPKVVATRTMNNLLRSQALSKLKETFPGAISNDERKALEALQGLDAKGAEERKVIIMNAYKALQSSRARHQKRLNEINQGLYRDTTATGGLGDGNN